MIHGLSALTDGRDLEVLRAWGRKSFVEVVDICDDVIEGNRYEVGDDLSSLFQQAEVGADAQAKRHESQQAELYLFHRNVKAAALNQLAKWSDAIRVVEETIKMTNGLDRDALCLKGTALNALGTMDNSKESNEEALKCFTEALKMLPPGGFDLETMLNQATLFFKLGRHNEAEMVARSALNLMEVQNPVVSSETTPEGGSSSSSPMNRLDLALSRDPFASEDQSNPTAIRQVGLDRDHMKYDPDLHMLIAAIYVTTKRLESALAECKLGVAALKRKAALGSSLLSKFYEIQYTTLLQLGRTAEAELVAKMLTKIHPYSLPHLEQYVRLMIHLKRPFNVIWPVLKAFVPNVAHDGQQYTQLLSLMLMTSEAAGNVDESLRVCTDILKLGPHESAYQVKAVLLLKKGRPDEALLLCEKAIADGLGTHEIHLAKALAYEALQLWDDAHSEYETVILKDPNYGPAHYHLAKSLARRGRNAEALQAFDRALKVEDVPISQVLIAKALLLKDMGRLKDALEVYQQLAKIDPAVAQQLPTLSNVWKKGNPREFMSPETLARAQVAHDHLQAADAGLPGLFGGFKN